MVWIGLFIIGIVKRSSYEVVIVYVGDGGKRKECERMKV